MTANLDKSLDDIISSSKPARSEGGPVRRGRPSGDRPSPYGQAPRQQAPVNHGNRADEVRLYVGNLAWDVSWQDLKDHMRSAGGVVRTEVMSFPDGRSKGCGIVVFDDQFSAARAVQNLTNTELKGRSIWLREDREAGRRQGGPMNAPQGRPNAPMMQRGPAAGRAPQRSNLIADTPDNCRVFVGNLPWSYTWKELKDISAEFGDIRRADVEIGHDGRSRGHGIVAFVNADDAQRCIDGLDGGMCEGRAISVHLDQKPAHAAPASAPRGQQQPTAPRGQQQQSNGNGHKVYIGNLPWGCSWQNLKDMAKEHGDVLFADVAEEPNGRSRGFGVVSFRDINDAYGCIDQLNGADYEGRALIVKEDARNPLR